MHPCRPPPCRPPPRPPVCRWPPPAPVWWNTTWEQMWRQGYIRQPELRGYPAPSFIRQRGWPHPRRPWPFETESRAPGTGLVMGHIPRHRSHWEVVW